MRVSPDDRRNLAQLGMTILVVGLIVAPLSHLLVDHAGVQLDDPSAWLTHGGTQAHPHEHAHPHGHSHPHPPESLQHLTALFAPAAAAAPKVVRVEAVALAAVQRPVAPPRAAAWVHPAMPQGP